MSEPRPDNPPCPECCWPVVPIAYGLMPRQAPLDENGYEQYIEGGCCLEPDSPRWGCVPCRRRSIDDYLPSFMLDQG